MAFQWGQSMFSCAKMNQGFIQDQTHFARYLIKEAAEKAFAGERWFVCRAHFGDRLVVRCAVGFCRCLATEGCMSLPGCQSAPRQCSGGSRRSPSSVRGRS